jgi:DNA replication protein DnaC
MTKAKQDAAAVGERLPYLLHKLKAPRVLERLDQTAARARAESWPYEQFLEVLLEAEVFARDASGARTRVRAAQFPARKTLDDFDWSAQPARRAPARDAPGAAFVDRGARQRLLLRPAGDRQSHLAIALGMKACEHGFRVAFATAQEWGLKTRGGPGPQPP